MYYLSIPMIIAVVVLSLALVISKIHQNRKLLHYQSLFLLSIIYFAPPKTGWNHERERIERIIKALNLGLSGYEPDFPQDDVVINRINSVTKSLFACTRKDVETEVTEKVDVLYEIVSQLHNK